MIIIICPGELNAQTFPGFWDTSVLPNLGRTTRFSNNQIKKKKEFLPNSRRYTPGWPQSKIERKR